MTGGGLGTRTTPPTNNSAFALAARESNPCEIIDLLDVADRFFCELEFIRAITIREAPLLKNVAIVGSVSATADALSPYPDNRQDVAAVGDNLAGLCLMDDSSCTDNIQYLKYGGTSSATPQVAGLTALL